MVLLETPDNRGVGDPSDSSFPMQAVGVDKWNS